MSINGVQLGECVSAKKYSHNWDNSVHILSRVIIQDDKRVKINYQNNNNKYYYYNNNNKKQCQFWGHQPFRFVYFTKNSFEIEGGGEIQHFWCYVVKEDGSVWNCLFICSHLQYSHLLFRRNCRQKDRQREETPWCRDISVIKYARLVDRKQNIFHHWYLYTRR